MFHAYKLNSLKKLMKNQIKHPPPPSKKKEKKEMPENFLNVPNADFNVISDDDSINLSILKVFTTLVQKCRPT